MRTAVLGLLVVVTLALVALAAGPERLSPPAQRPAAVEAGVAKEMVALSVTVGDKYQQVTVIDPKLRVMSVYHIDLVTGKIALRSVRNIHWDLQMTEFNSENPLPREIQALIEPR
jgi:hypothetical protein